jgi:hypothetical protein
MTPSRRRLRRRRRSSLFSCKRSTSDRARRADEREAAGTVYSYGSRGYANSGAKSHSLSGAARTGEDGRRLPLRSGRPLRFIAQGGSRDPRRRASSGTPPRRFVSQFQTDAVSKHGVPRPVGLGPLGPAHPSPEQGQVRRGFGKAERRSRDVRGFLPTPFAQLPGARAGTFDLVLTGHDPPGTTGIGRRETAITRLPFLGVTTRTRSRHRCSSATPRRPSRESRFRSRNLRRRRRRSRPCLSTSHRRRVTRSNGGRARPRAPGCVRRA